MFKKIFIFTCILVTSAHLTATTLKDDSMIFQALMGLSRSESQELISHAHGFINQLHQMGLSDQQIDKMISDQLGAVARIGADAKRGIRAEETDMYAGYVKTSTMLKLLAAAAVISGAVGVGIGVGLCLNQAGE